MEANTGTSVRTNPNAIKTIQKNTIFTNVAETSDGGVYWEGIDQPLASGIKLISWKGKECENSLRSSSCLV